MPDLTKAAALSAETVCAGASETLMVILPCESVLRQRLPSYVCRARNLDQHADPLVGAVVLLFALIEPLEDRLAQWTALVQFGGPVKAQEAGFEYAVALCLEIRVHDADAQFAAEIGERLLLRALPIGEVLVVIDQHRALGGDVGPVRPGGRQQARIAVDPGVVDKRSDLLADRHCYSRFPSLMPPGIRNSAANLQFLPYRGECVWELAYRNFSGAHPTAAYNALVLLSHKATGRSV